MTLIRPEHYKLVLAPDLETRTFAGEVTIDVRVDERVPRIDLDAVGLEISGDRLDRPFEAGLHQIRLSFRGSFGETHGLYGGDGWVATQLQPTHARTLFPCFDDPRFKATFDLYVIAPMNARVIANTPVERASFGDGPHDIVKFTRTPPMPPYLLGFAFGVDDVATVPIDGSGELSLASPAARAAVQLLGVLGDFERMLGRYPWPKLDVVALPQLEAAGIETTGTLFFRASALDEEPGRVLRLVAHELAHQWFGSLVTPASWEELWLSEGFATWAASKVTRRPLDDVRATRVAMAADSLSTSRALQSAPGSLQELFDPIAYEKGAAILRMLEAWLGEETFLRGVRLFLQRHANGSVTSADLWRALEEVSGKSVAAIATPLVTKAGVPRVRFDESGTPDPSIAFPVTTKPAGAGVFGNAGAAGYYRCSYSRPRDIDPTALTPAEQFTLLDDAWSEVWDCRSDVLAFLRLASALPPDLTRDHIRELHDLVGQPVDEPAGTSLAARLAHAKTRAAAWAELKATWNPSMISFGGGEILHALSSASDPVMRHDIAQFFAGRGADRILGMVLERIDSRIRFREREQRKFEAWRARQGAPDAPATSELHQAFMILNSLAAGFQGAAAGRALLDRFGFAAPEWMHPAADLFQVASSLEQRFLQVFRGAAMVDAQVLELAARLSEDLLASAVLAESAPPRAVVVALLARQAVVRESFLSGMIAFFDLFGMPDAADGWRVHLGASDREVLRSRMHVARLLAGQDDPDLHGQALADAFRSQASDLIALR